MKKTLAHYIDKVVTENSGGIKFIELAMALLDIFEKEDKNLHDRIRENGPDMLEEEIRTNMPHLGILEYSMEMGSGLQRIKSFVYRKIS